MKYEEGDSVEVIHAGTGDWVEAEIIDVLSMQCYVEYFDGGTGFAFFTQIRELKDD